MIFLSATTPNCFEFSDWIGRTKRKTVHVIKTNYRPVPLSHFLWAGAKLHKVMQGSAAFLDNGYVEATKALLPASALDPLTKKSEQKGRPKTGSKELGWQTQGNKQNWISLIRFFDRELLTPAVVFSFSKKKCEEIAHQISSLDLNTAKEKSAVVGFSRQAVSRLSQTDAQLPQVLSVCEMVTRGIGVHHGGLLPILKEMVEILFSRNLIKILFATETFAMGK
jgi:antiviral helicase SKI2